MSETGQQPPTDDVQARLRAFLNDEALPLVSNNPTVDDAATATTTATVDKPPQLNERHVRDLAASGITPEFAIRNGLYSADAAQVQRMLGRGRSVGAGLVIPYPDPNTGGTLQVEWQHGDAKRQADFVRVRLDDPSLAADAKYLSRAKAGQAPYITPDAAAAIKNGARTIILVEGEKKALSAQAHGFPAVIGLSGNWGWKQKDAHELLPLLAQFIPPGTKLVIVWDSDAAMNAGFSASTRMIQDVLRRINCTVKVVVLLQEGTAKIGLDDFLVRHGAAEFSKLVENTPALPNERQVSSSELICTWVKNFAPALKPLTEADAKALLTETFPKGLIDRVDHATRQAVLTTLQAHTSVIVAEVFRVCVERTLAETHGNALTTTTANSPVSVGDLATTPDGTLVKIADVDTNIAWVHKPRQADTSWPVPVSVLQVVNAAVQRLLRSPAALATAFLTAHYWQDNHQTLRSHRGRFYVFNGYNYVEVPEADIAAQVMGFLRSNNAVLAVPRIQRAVIANLQATGVCHIPSDVEAPCWLRDGFPSARNVISFKNGNLNVDALLNGAGDELVFTPPTYELFTTTARDFDFNPDAECPLWRKFLEEVLPDPAVRAFAQEIMGLAQIPCTNMHKFFLFYGEGANGKSVFMDIMEAITGTRNVCSVSLARFGERFALWPLTTCLVNLVAEMPAVDSMHTNVRIAEDKLKAVVSGDIIDIERKNKDIVKGRVTARLFFNTNEPPIFADRSNGTWRRLEIVPFVVTIPDKQQIRNLAQQIIASELSGVFNYALEGLIRLLKRGRFDVPEACNALKALHRGDCAPEVGWLDDAVVAAGADDFLANEVLYSEYQSAMRAVGHQPLSIRKLGTELLRKFPSAKRARIATPTLGLQQRGFSGVKLRLLDALEKGAAAQ